MTDATRREGGCACGRLRYRVAAPIDHVVHCHCVLCRRASGAPFVTWFTVPSTSFAFTRGEPAWYRSSETALRHFCPRCGTPITFQEDAKPEEIDVTAASLDDATDLKPLHHVWATRRLGWVKVDKHLPDYEANGP